MPIITLKDQTKKTFPDVVSVYEVAKSIGDGLARSAIAAKVNDNLVDLSYEIKKDSTLEIITNKEKESLEIIRHSTAHLLAHAVQNLFPDAKVTIGPVIEDGFYYDFDYKRPFTTEDLTTIEKEMKKIVKQNLTIERIVLSRDEAIKLFVSKNENYKVEIIKDIPGDEDLSFYKEGDFVDLCRGPHVPSTKKLKVFKLMKVAGAYWRGDAKNAMLQRIYGTAFHTKDELKEYLHRLEEAEKRDHRKIAKRLDLFHIENVAPGMVFWHPNGWVIYQEVIKYLRNKLNKAGYSEIKTPELVDKSLWIKSGHWDKFKQNMYTLNFEEFHHALKPMNCPCHIEVFNQGIKSYRELPIRLSEFGCCHRHEPSGALHGLMRVRSFVQDDAHIFCTEDQVEMEVERFNNLLFDIYKDFGFEDVIIKLATRPDVRVGSDEIWDKAEKILDNVLKKSGIVYEISEGEGAFYGPKIEFSLKDCLGRIWQCGTMQVDFSMPERLNANYVAEDGTKKVPIMLHRAILGSIERFIGILIEEYEGLLPVWLSPKQVVVMNITDKQASYSTEVFDKLNSAGFRVIKDLRNEKIGFKIREHTIKKVPYLLVLGDKELSSKTVTVRKIDGKDLGSMSLFDFIAILKEDIGKFGRKSY